MISKKGTIVGRKMMFYVIFLVMVTINLIILITFLSFSRADIAQIPQGMEDYILTQRFLKSPECFTYKDNLRVIPYIIEWDKFADSSLQYCFHNADYTKGFRLTLKNKDLDEKRVIKTSNWRGAYFGAIIYDVTIFKDDSFYNGELTIEIQNPK